jgi:hypothetical protein
VVAQMPLIASTTLEVDPPAGSDLTETTISTGLMTSDTAVTATFPAGVTLSGVMEDSLGNVLPDVAIYVYNTSGCAGGSPNIVGQGTTGSDGLFNVAVPSGTYSVAVVENGVADPSTDPPSFRFCTDGVDLTSSVDDTLVIPVTYLTVTVEDSNGNLVPGATVESSYTGEDTATFDLFPGLPAGGFIDSGPVTTDASGTAVVAQMPLIASTTLEVDPPAGSDLTETTISTGLMTSNSAVTAVLYSVSGTVTSATTGDLAGQTVTLFPVTTGNAVTGGWKNPSASGVSTVTNSSGFYGLTVPAGKYKLQISGGKANSSGLPDLYKVKTKVALALATGRSQNLTLPVVDLTVTVKNQAGKALKGVKVSVPCTATTVTLAASVTASGSSCGLATTNSSGIAKFGLLATPSVSVTATPKAPYHPVTEKSVAAKNSTSLTIVVP